MSFVSETKYLVSCILYRAIPTCTNALQIQVQTQNRGTLLKLNDVKKKDWNVNRKTVLNTPMYTTVNDTT